MLWQDGYIAVDWGTTNRRAYRVSAAGEVVDEIRDGLGVLSVPAGGFPAAAAQLRSRLGALPMLMAGMVGSNLGWTQAPYVSCAAGLAELKQGICWVEPDTAITPGVAFDSGDRADVMRGEELQVLGAVAAELVPADALVCHPGTHAKWVQVSGGRIASFKTSMTGEMFDLLRKHSILAGGLQQPVQDGPQFAAGVSRALAHTDLLAELFGVRAQSILGRRDGDEPADFSAFVSGLLIGSDVREALGSAGANPISVAGEPRLTALYAKALEIAGRQTVEVDGAIAFIAGARALVEML